MTDTTPPVACPAPEKPAGPAIIAFDHDDGIQIGGPTGAILYTIATTTVLRDPDERTWSPVGSSEPRYIATRINKLADDGLIEIHPGRAGLRDGSPEAAITPAGLMVARRWVGGRAVQQLLRPATRHDPMDWGQRKVDDSHDEALAALLWAITSDRDGVWFDDWKPAFSRFVVDGDSPAAAFGKLLAGEDGGHAPGERAELAVTAFQRFTDEAFVGLNFLEARALAPLLIALFNVHVRRFVQNGDNWFGEPE